MRLLPKGAAAMVPKGFTSLGLEEGGRAGGAGAGKRQHKGGRVPEL
jgi:hypothetical protein